MTVGIMPLVDTETLVVYIDDEKQRKPATDFFNTALEAASIPVPQRFRIRGQELMKGYQTFKIVVMPIPARPPLESASSQHTAWYSI